MLNVKIINAISQFSPTKSSTSKGNDNKDKENANKDNYSGQSFQDIYNQIMHIESDLLNY